MKIIEIANYVDDVLRANEFQIQNVKSGEVASILIKNHDRLEVEFCKVGQCYGVKIKGHEQEITKPDFENILAPYLGRRMFIMF